MGLQAQLIRDRSLFRHGGVLEGEEDPDPEDPRENEDDQEKELGQRTRARGPFDDAYARVEPAQEVRVAAVFERRQTTDAATEEVVVQHLQQPHGHVGSRPGAVEI